MEMPLARAELTPVMATCFPSMNVDDAQHLDQRRFNRAVFAQQRVDLAGFELKVHVLQGLDAGERLADVFHFEQIFAHRVSPPFLLHEARRAARRGAGPIVRQAVPPDAALSAGRQGLLARSRLRKGLCPDEQSPFPHCFLTAVSAGQSRVSAYCQPSVPYSATLSALIMKVSMG